VTQRLFDDDEDSPPSRSYTRDPDRSDPGGGPEREISLGAPAILGIFFALALVCACFFGFGYTMGRKSAQSTTPDIATANTDTSSNGAPKPAAGSLANQPDIPAAQPAEQPAADNSIAQPATQPDAAPAAPPATQKNVASQADGMIVGDRAVGNKPPPSAPAATNKPSTSNPQPAAALAGTFLVQVAAVSSQDVADILTSSLQKKGYSVSVRHEPQDKLLHVQIGPFATRPEALAMQQRVLADGFNAIVK